MNYRTIENLHRLTKNAHIDLRVMTACYMLLKPSDDHPDLLVKYVKALLAGKRIQVMKKIKAVIIK